MALRLPTRVPVFWFGAAFAGLGALWLPCALLMRWLGGPDCINAGLVAVVGGAFWMLGAACDPLPAEHPPGHCRSCGYDLAGLGSERCPECGAATGSPES